MFKIEYSPFCCGSSLACYTKDRMIEMIYEYSQSQGSVKLFDQDLNVKESYEISIPNVSLVVIWGVFLIVIHQQGAKLIFSLLSRETLQNIQTLIHQVETEKKDLKYFSKPFLNSEIVMEDIFENKDNVSLF